MESFEQVAKLDSTALRDLFARGRPEQRVWAIWALAMRTGGIVVVGDAAKDPDPGVRRTMAVMLAGHGETDMLVELARRDPNANVRESAMQIVTRLAAQGALDHEIVLDASRSDPAVRVAILAATDRGAPAFLIELAGDLLAHGTTDEQADAFEALMRTESSTVARAALAWLEKLPEVRARDACARMVRAVGEYAVACELARGPRRLRSIALGVMHRPAWPTVEQLLGDDMDMLLEVVRLGRISVPAEALARAALDGHAEPLVERLAADLAIIDAPSAELRPMLFLLDQHYSTWLAALDRELKDLKKAPQAALGGTEETPEDYVRARSDARKQLAKLQKQIRRLMRG